MPGSGLKGEAAPRPCAAHLLGLRVLGSGHIASGLGLQGQVPSSLRVGSPWRADLECPQRCQTTAFVASRESQTSFFQKAISFLDSPNVLSDEVLVCNKCSVDADLGIMFTYPAKPTGECVCACPCVHAHVEVCMVRVCECA